MTITLKFYIIINKVYLYNYNESLFHTLIKVQYITWSKNAKNKY